MIIMTENRDNYYQQLKELIQRMESQSEIDSHPNLIPEQAKRIKNIFMSFEIPDENSNKEEFTQALKEYRKFQSSLRQVKLLLKSKGRKAGAQVELSSEIIDDLLKDVSEVIRALEHPITEERKKKDILLNKINVISGLVGGIIGAVKIHSTSGIRRTSI